MLSLKFETCSPPSVVAFLDESIGVGGIEFSTESRLVSFKIPLDLFDLGGYEP